MIRSIALDASSTTIGWVLAEDGKRRFSGTYKLKGNIDERVERAYSFVSDLLARWPGEVLVTEAPVGRFAKALIPQVRVNGAVILACRHRGVQWREVTPSQAKKALTGGGKAEKQDMLCAAAYHLGYDGAELVYCVKSGTWRAINTDQKVLFDEHEADAVGVMLAAEAIKGTSED